MKYENGALVTITYTETVTVEVDREDIIEWEMNEEDIIERAFELEHEGNALTFDREVEDYDIEEL